MGSNYYQRTDAVNLWPSGIKKCRGLGWNNSQQFNLIINDICNVCKAHWIRKKTNKKENSKTGRIIRKTNLNWINPYLHSLRLCKFPLIFPQECLIKSESRTCLLWVVSSFLYSGEISFFFGNNFSFLLFTWEHISFPYFLSHGKVSSIFHSSLFWGN